MKTITTIIIALLMTISVKSQIGFEFAGGYALGINKSYTGADIVNSKAVNKYHSFGEGSRILFRSYYQMKNKLQVGMEFNYSVSPLLIIENSYFDHGAMSYNKQQSYLFDIEPYMGYQLENGIYGRLGMIISLWQKTEREVLIAFGQNNRKLLSHSIEKGKISLGATFSLGYNYKLSETLSLFGEIQFRQLVIKPKDGKMFSSTLDGKDIFNSYSTVDKEWYYDDEFEWSTNQPSDYKEHPQKKLYNQKNLFQHSSIGILLGLRYSF